MLHLLFICLSERLKPLIRVSLPFSLNTSTNTTSYLKYWWHEEKWWTCVCVCVPGCWCLWPAALGSEEVDSCCSLRRTASSPPDCPWGHTVTHTFLTHQSGTRYIHSIHRSFWQYIDILIFIYNIKMFSCNVKSKFSRFFRSHENPGYAPQKRAKFSHCLRL